jgi:CRP-like cAMP-binding protein
MTWTIYDANTLVYIAGAFYVLGMLIVNQIVLRILVLAGTSFYILYYAKVADTPLWDPIFISCLILLSNLFGIAVLVLRKSRLMVPRVHRDIYAQFEHLPPGDFRTLMRLAKRHVLTEARCLTREGEPQMRLFYVISGHTTIEKKGNVFDVPPGSFVGEIAFMTGKPASATTQVEAGTELLEWPNADLRAACARSPRFRLALDSAISMDLAQKVAYSIAPSHTRWLS